MCWPPTCVPQIGTKMLAANRSYRARISYLPAEADQLAAAGKVCRRACWVVGRGDLACTRAIMVGLE